MATRVKREAVHQSDLEKTLAWLERHGSAKVRDGMTRYGIVARHAYGMKMSTLLARAKFIGTDQQLSLQLWDSGCYEARLLATMIGDPLQVTRRQMDTWAKGFENWADCDTACFKLFDRVPFAAEKARQWTASKQEMVKRGGFALIASRALHDKKTEDRRFLEFLPLIEKGAQDERNFVKKGVSWALRSIGRRAGAYLAALQLATRLAQSEHPTCRWVGKDAQRELLKLAQRESARGREAGSWKWSDRD